MLWLVIILYLTFIPINVEAKELCLDSLNIKNGELSLEFEKYNTKYTVMIDKNIEALEIEYQIENDIDIIINNNHDLQNNSVVTITLTKDKDTVDYELYILKDEEEIIATFQEPTINENSNFMYEYKIYIIPLACILLILISFKIIFLKHKK